MAPLKSIVASATAVDPTLNALFASSVRPVEGRAKPKYEPLITSKPRSAPVPKPIEPLGDAEEEEEEDEDSSEDDSESDSDGESEDEEDEEDEEEEEDSVELKEKVATTVGPDSGAGKRKRKKRDEDEDLEVRYLEKISRDVAAPAEKRVKRGEETQADGDSSENEDDADPAGNSDDDADDADEPLVHESLLGTENGGDTEAVGNTEVEKDKAARTVFLSNVSIEAVTSKSAKRTLLEHLSSVAGKEKEVKKDKKKKKGKEGDSEETDKDGQEKKGEDSSSGPIVESLRFRSVPFATAALPKRAAFITKAVMGATAQATNAYAVYATAAAARAAVRTLNGTVVLGRHLRADSVAHPAPVNHRRCVFVGNLGFVDDETVMEAPGGGAGGEDGSDAEEAAAAAPRKRHKVPMDVEEGLWRTFGKHAGRVESVRVVRDPATRVGKGIAYVQFYDANSVEAALLLADKKYPPLLPRPLRVSRCKAPHKTARAAERAAEQRALKASADGGAGSERKKHQATFQKNKSTGYTPKLTAEQQTLAGRTAKLLGRAAAAGGPQPQQKQQLPVVFEGMRARVGHNSNLFKKNKNNKKDGANGKESNNKTRRATRAANWKKN